MQQLFLLTALGLLTLGCTQTESGEEVTPTTGISSQVLYGQGDCMPVIDEAARTYTAYTGELYFIRKAALDQLGNDSFEQLKRASLHYPVRQGKLVASPPADTYVLMPAAYYTNEQTLVITAGQSVQQDLKFWRCLSY